jgi:hypothetical protein
MRPPSYWQCRRAIAWLNRFQGLLIHREHNFIYSKDALPIEKLLPGVEEKDRWHVIDREINRLVPLVSDALHRIAIQTNVGLKSVEQDLASGVYGLKEVDQTYDLIVDYFQLPRDGRRRHDFFELLMQTLERGIGGYEALKRAGVRRALSPISWLAWIVEIPIRVLERAGVPMEDASSKGIQAIAWVLRLGMLVIVAFVAARLGFSIPWDKISAFLK